MPSGWNDVVSSLKVFRTSHGQKAIGTWVAVTTQTEDIDITYHVGFTKTVTTETMENESYELQMQMSEGIEFEGFSESETITQSYSKSIMNDTKNEVVSEIWVEAHVPCEGAVGTEGGVGLWQFVVKNAKTSKDVVLHSVNTVCRYGELHAVPPKCPWNACLNGDCSVCASDWAEPNSASEFLQ